MTVIKINSISATNFVPKEHRKAERARRIVQDPLVGKAGVTFEIQINDALSNP